MQCKPQIEFLKKSMQSQVEICIASSQLVASLHWHWHAIYINTAYAIVPSMAMYECICVLSWHQIESHFKVKSSYLELMFNSLIAYPHNCFWICLIGNWNAFKSVLCLNLQNCSSFKNPLSKMASTIFRLMLLIYGNHVKDLSSSVTAHENVLFLAC